jgi:hypothetical protein
MSPNQWGPSIWILFHSIASKINEDTFSLLGPQFFNIIKKICNNLPCPDCSLHATAFLSKVNISKIKTKQDLIHLLYIFHNFVNKRKNKPLFDVNQLEKYKNVDLNTVCSNFASVYKTRGNMKLLADNFQRQMIVKEFRNWIIANRQNLQ